MLGGLRGVTGGLSVTSTPPNSTFEVTAPVSMDQRQHTIYGRGVKPLMAQKIHK